MAGKTAVGSVVIVTIALNNLYPFNILPILKSTKLNDIKKKSLY